MYIIASYIAVVTACFVLFMLLGYLMFKDFCENVMDEPVPQLNFYEEVSTWIIHSQVSTLSYNIVRRFSLSTARSMWQGDAIG